MTMAKFTADARRAPRQAHDSVLEFLDDRGGVARLVDVSSLGARFAATRTLAQGARIRARMRLLNAGVSEIAGTVVRVEEKANFTLYAVRFEPAAGVLL